MDSERMTESIYTLQKDMAQIGPLVERLDITIEKLTEVSSNVSTLLAVHDNRIEFQEKLLEKTQTLIEDNRRESDKNIKDVYYRVESVERDLYSEIEANQEKVLKEIKDMRAESTLQHNELKARVLRIDKWMWTMIGGLAVITLLIQIGMKFIQ
jgi:gas vesicle protein